MLRWLRIIFSVFAITSGALFLLSFIWLFVYATPLANKQSQLDIELIRGKLTYTLSRFHPYAAVSSNFDIQNIRSVQREIELATGDMDFFPDLGSGPQFQLDRFNFIIPSATSNWQGTKLTFPLWLPTLIFGLWPTLALTRHIKRRYFTHGVCRKCGYDMRGTPSGVCPECGHHTKTAVPADT